MKEEFIFLREIEKDLQQLTEAGDVLCQTFVVLTQSIQYIFNLIKACERIDMAQEYFDSLDDIQRSLADLVYNKDIGIPDRLWRFMKDFDNFDEAKKNYFEKIKKGDYTF